MTPEADESAKIVSRPVLFYFPGCPMLDSAGSQVRVKWLLTQLAPHCEKLTFCSYANGSSGAWTEADEERFRRQFPTVDLILEHEGFVQRQWKSIKNLSLALFPGSAKRILNFSIPFFTKKIREYFKKNPDVIVLCSYADGLTQLNGLSGRPYIIDTHDIKFMNYIKRTNAKVTELAVLRKMRSEMAGLNSASGVIAISAFEANLFRMLLSDVPIYFVPATPEPIPLKNDATFTYDMMFVGSPSRPNIEGITEFIKANGAWLSNYRLAICGKVGQVESVQDLCRNRPNIALLGVVPDLDTVFSQSKCTLSPVDGTGLKIKVVEALARGKPVFASAQSTDGLVGGYEQCVFPTHQAVMSRILDDPEALGRAEAAAIDYYEKFRNSDDTSYLLDRLRVCGLTTA